MFIALNPHPTQLQPPQRALLTSVSQGTTTPQMQDLWLFLSKSKSSVTREEIKPACVLQGSQRVRTWASGLGGERSMQLVQRRPRLCGPLLNPPHLWVIPGFQAFYSPCKVVMSLVSWISQGMSSSLDSFSRRLRVEWVKTVSTGPV